MSIDKDLLDKMTKNIEDELSVKRLGRVQRRALEMDQLMVMYIRQSSEDHERIGRLENSSIVMWMQKNPKLTVFIITIYVALSAFVDFRTVLALVLGIGK